VTATHASFFACSLLFCRYRASFVAHHLHDVSCGFPFPFFFCFSFLFLLAIFRSDLLRLQADAA